MLLIEDIITNRVVVGIVFAFFIISIGSIAVMLLIIYNRTEVIDNDKRP